jgi:hypothetical protein
MDSDGDGIPDYIEELTKDSDDNGIPDNTEAVKEYSDSVLDSMFKDSDRD